jgi:hypothetical protein
MRVTPNAKAKILNLLEDDDSVFRITSTPETPINLIPNSEIGIYDVTISITPKIVVDLSTVTKMIGKTVDFNYETSEFEIK